MSGTVIESLFKVTASVIGANALKDLGDQIAKTSTAGANLTRSLNQGAMALKAFAASEAVTGIKRLVSNAINLGDTLEQVKEKTGVSVQTLGHLKGAADEAGVSIEGIAKSFKELNKNILESEKQTSDQAAAFKSLGIDVYDANGQLKSSEKIFYEIADAFAAHADGAEKSTAATVLFGKAGSDLIPILNKGSEEIQRLGLTIGPEFTRNANEFSDNMARINIQFQQLSVDLAAQILPGLVELSNNFNENNTAVKTLVVMIKGLETAFVGLGTAADAITTAIGASFASLALRAEGLYKQLKAISTLDFSSLSQIRKETDAAVKSVWQDGANGFIGGARGAQNNLDAIWGGNLGQGSAGAGSNLPGAEKPKLNFSPSGGSNAGGGDWLAKQREALITLKQEADYIGKTSVEVEKLKDARKMEADIAEKARNMTRDQAAAFKEQAQAIIEARQAVIDYNYEQSRTFGAGASEFFAKYSEAARDSASQVKEVLQNAFKGAEDALLKFTQTGKLNFKDMARSILEDMARIAIQKSILGPISSMFGGFFSGAAFANGGIMTSGGPLPLKKYANGGVANSPQLALYGEGRMPEAYVPLPDGRRIPVALQGGGGGGPAVGSVTVQVNIDKDGQTKESSKSTSTDAGAFGRSIAAAVKAQILQEQRPGGLLDKTR